MVALTIPDTYGYCVLGVGGFWVMNLIHMGFVAHARKKYDVKYPNLYAPHGHKSKLEFDCIQRAHQNLLENLPMMTIAVLINGVMFPRWAAISAAGWTLCRLVYLYGYMTGPDKRVLGGGLAHLFDFPMYIGLFFTGYYMLQAGGQVPAAGVSA